MGITHIGYFHGILSLWYLHIAHQFFILSKLHEISCNKILSLHTLNTMKHIYDTCWFCFSLLTLGGVVIIKYSNIQFIMVDNILSTSQEIAPRWMLQNLIDEMSTLVSVMFWCHQATSHYMSQYGPIYIYIYMLQLHWNSVIEIYIYLLAWYSFLLWNRQLGRA